MNLLSNVGAILEQRCKFDKFDKARNFYKTDFSIIFSLKSSLGYIFVFSICYLLVYFCFSFFYLFESSYCLKQL